MVDLSKFSSNIEWSCSQTLFYFSILVGKKIINKTNSKNSFKKKNPKRKRRNCGESFYAIQSNISGNIKDL